MASIQYDAGYMRHNRSGYSALPRPSSSSLNLSSRPPSNASMMSGLKSIFCSKPTYSSSSHAYAGNRPSGFSGSSGIVLSSGLACTRPGFVRVKTSDSNPIISPQLEDRLLQLADRSRRLGVHRFSRTRNALVLNELVHVAPPKRLMIAPSGSGSSLSTWSSKPSISHAVAQVRE